MRAAWVLCALTMLALPAIAQEQEDHAAKFAAVQGGAVYDEMDGVDGSLVSENFILTHLTCSKGSSKIRLLMPVGKDGAGQDDSTLVEKAGQWRITIKAYGKRYPKDVTFKPVKDGRSLYNEQAEITVTVGDPLWRALLDRKDYTFWAMNGSAGTNVYIAGGAEFEKFRKACGIRG
ncbi:hypothetical protein [Aestuariivirga sp.]|uniref:hypothetical protein n=1 Tax=Aestuariivirga sp. TaxID=2650926 RepID=UPI0039E6613C